MSPADLIVLAFYAVLYLVPWWMLRRLRRQQERPKPLPSRRRMTPKMWQAVHKAQERQRVERRETPRRSER